MKKIFGILLVLALLLVFINVAKPKLAAFYFNQGNDYLNRGLYEDALISFKKSLSIQPNMAVTHFGLAESYLKTKNKEKAMAEYQKTIQLDQNFVGAYLTLSQIYSKDQSYEEALNLLKLAKDKFPNNQDILKLLDEISFEYAADCVDKGTSLYLSGEQLKARTLLNKAIELRPNFAFAHYILAFFYFKESNLEEAQKSLQNAIRSDPHFGPAYKLLGDIYFQKGDFQKAIANYESALPFNANDVSLKNDLGIALMQMERYEEAINYLKEASDQEPNNFNIRYSLASVYRDKGMLDQAISEYNKVISVRSDYPNVHNDLGDIYKQQGKTNEAAQEYNKEIQFSKKKLQTNPNDPETLNNLAYAFNGIGQPTKAKELIEKVLNISPNYRQAHLTLSKINENIGKNDEAILALNKAKALSAQTNFIDRDIERLKNNLQTTGVDVVYLKNGRTIQGKIIEANGEKVVLEIMLGNAKGNVTFYRNEIEHIEKSGQ
jgi:tetratricopeptide (TPR) repeat protein